MQSASASNRKLSYSFQAEDLTIESAYNIGSPANSIPAIRRRSSLANNNNNSLELNDAERSSVQDNTLQANFTTIADETESAGRLREKANLIEQTYP